MGRNSCLKGFPSLDNPFSTITSGFFLHIYLLWSLDEFHEGGCIVNSRYSELEG
jgi:hypothetical protein